MDPAGGSTGNVVITASAPNNVSQPPPQNTQPISQPSQVPQQQPAPAPAPPAQAAPPQPNQNMIVDQGSISNLVTGLQQATMNGATQLPSRDIPVTSHHISQDPEIQQNYVPPAETEDYIDIEENDDTILNEYNKKVASADSDKTFVWGSGFAREMLKTQLEKHAQDTLKAKAPWHIAESTEAFLLAMKESGMDYEDKVLNQTVTTRYKPDRAVPQRCMNQAIGKLWTPVHEAMIAAGKW